MAARHTRHTQDIVKQSTDLALAVPQVVAHRLTRMALSGPQLSERDRKEFHLMGAEKVAAFTESWNAMALQAMRANAALASNMMRSLWSPWTAMTMMQTASEMQTAALSVVSTGMKPIGRKASANAKRLAKTRLR